MTLIARKVVGIRFQQAGRMYFFDPGDVTDYVVNDWVVVKTDLGLDAGRVHILPTDSPMVMIDPPLGRVVRRATAQDRFEMAKRKRVEPETAEKAQEMAAERGIPVKILGADWQMDGGSLVLFYSATERVELAELGEALGAQFGTAIEFRRMAAREETKVLGGVGTCGRELCCSSWLDKFSNISIRMAKEQDLPLNQSKLTGVCGRLKCCLIYELETYQEVRGALPKLGETIHIPSCVGGQCGTSGCAMVQGASVTKEAITVGLMDGNRTTLTAEELGVTFRRVPAHTKGVGA
ncbi:MAG: hypothetical protein FJ034_08345, partial [Chloroflexi bacterium]|nr:hypothetical protein [Chloroflexota bacterium]